MAPQDDTGRETGRRVQGQNECSDGSPDAGAPRREDALIHVEKHTQIRVIDAQRLR